LDDELLVWAREVIGMDREETPRPSQFMGRPRHRLFAVFDDPAVGRDVAEKLRGGPNDLDDHVWIFYGEEGSRRIDVTGNLEGIRGKIIRTVERAFSSDIEYLNILDEALRSGHLVIAVAMADADAVRIMADHLRADGGHSFAYFSNWEFQPVNLG
jgi:hypothetical protein